jgi:Xaa-Pro aminopeptidase
MTTGDTGARLGRLREQMSERGLDWLLITQPENRRYLSGFGERDVSLGSSAAWLLIGHDAAHLITGFLYYEAAVAAAKGFEVLRAGPRFLDTVAEVVGVGPGKRIGFEAGWLTFELHRDLAERLGGEHELVATAGLVEGLRQIKDASEIEAIRAAVELTDRAFENVLGLIKPGVAERQVAWEIEKYMREHGAEGMAFEVAVAAGPNSAMPHHSSTDRPIAAGEPVWIDCGARLNGYCGDLTRSFCLGAADERFEEIYGIVLRAQAAAVAGLRAGLTGVEGDALARDVIKAAGHGDAFGHSLGHGIGLAVHELPRVSPLGKDALKPGMLTSVEPGIYLPGWGGVRIEDLVVVGEDGAQVLTRAPKSMVVT